MPSFQDVTLPATGSVVGGDGKWRSNDLVGATGGGGSAPLSWALDSGVLTLTTDGTNDFGTKANAKPLLVWKASDNTTAANLTLGRSSWTITPSSGVFDTNIFDTNNVRSYKSDMLADKQVLGGYTHPTGFTTALYVYKRSYKDFNPRTRYASRIRVNHDTVDTMTLQVGDSLVGESSGVTAVIAKIEEDTTIRYNIWCTDAGTFGASGLSPTFTPFWDGEVITGTSGEATVQGTFDSGASANHSYWGFNMKSLRPYSPYGANFLPDFYYGATTFEISDSLFHGGYKQITDATGEAGHWNGSSYDGQVASSPLVQFGDKGEYQAWSTEEMFIKPSTIATADGEFKVWINGHLLHAGTEWKTYTTSGEVITTMPPWTTENGVGSDSYFYDSYYYLDDEVHRVYLVNADHVNIDQSVNGTLELLPLPAMTWTTTSITAAYQDFMPNWTHIVIVKGDQTQLVVAR